MYKSLILSTVLFLSLNSFANVFTPIIKAAKEKSLPTYILEDMVHYGSRIKIKQSDWIHYRPGSFNSGTIYLSFTNIKPSDWTSRKWSLFYNEAFHAWWGTVFTKQKEFAGQKSSLFNDKLLRTKYKKAHPKNPLLAMEEGYSETLATLMISAYPKIKLDNNGNYIRVPADYETLYYRRCLLYTSPSPRDRQKSRMPSSA